MGFTCLVFRADQMYQTFEGFEGIDLLDQKVMEQLAPIVHHGLAAIERWDVLVGRIALEGDVIRIYADEAEDAERLANLPYTVVEKPLKPGFVDYLKDLSATPRVPIPEPRPDKLSQGIIYEFDKVVFEENTPTHARILMNAKTFAVFHKWCKGRLDLTVKLPLLKLGYQGDIWHPEVDLDSDEMLGNELKRQLWINKTIPDWCIFYDVHGTQPCSNDVAFIRDSPHWHFLGTVWPEAELLFRDLLRWGKNNPGATIVSDDDKDLRQIGWTATTPGPEPETKTWRIHVARLSTTWNKVSSLVRDELPKVNPSSSTDRIQLAEELTKSYQ